MTGHVDPVRVGISGWRYAAWRGTFYERLEQANVLR